MLAITEEIDEIVVKYGITYVRTSKRMLDRMFGENFERSREVKNEIVQRTFFYAFPSYFTSTPPSAYVPGSIAKVLTNNAPQRRLVEASPMIHHR